MAEDDEAIEPVSKEGITDKTTKSELNPYAVEFVSTMGQDGASLTGAAVSSGVHLLPQIGCNIYEKGKMRSCGTGLERTLQVSPEAGVE